MQNIQSADHTNAERTVSRPDSLQIITMTVFRLGQPADHDSLASTSYGMADNPVSKFPLFGWAEFRS